ncbi:octaprenyl diphosphate synthase, partial [Salmonella enterica subsp. enterica]|nr:octaprenyl diphosphate synthase [Salmonella enterica subsp. enterica serovar 4,[5],12:i:-]HAC9365309.1 octaprenyl diphosphate synthase [Salmonella enterica subsp. enterica serovar Typhimurium]
MKKKNTTHTVTFICGVFSVQSGYISNHKPYVTSFRHGIIGAISPAFAMNLEKINE